MSQEWTLSPGVKPGDSQLTVLKSAADHGCWEISACATADGASVDTGFGCKVVAPCRPWQRAHAGWLRPPPRLLPPPRARCMMRSAACCGALQALPKSCTSACDCNMVWQLNVSPLPATDHRCCWVLL